MSRVSLRKGAWADMDSAVFVKLLDLFTGDAFLCGADLLAASIRPLRYDIFGAVRPATRGKNQETNGKNPAHHFRREMVKSTRSMRDCRAGVSGKPASRATASSRYWRMADSA